MKTFFVSGTLDVTQLSAMDRHRHDKYEVIRYESPTRHRYHSRDRDRHHRKDYDNHLSVRYHNDSRYHHDSRHPPYETYDRRLSGTMRMVTCTNCSAEFRRDVLDSSTRCIRCRLSLSTYPIRPDIALGAPLSSISRDIIISRDTDGDSRLRDRLGGRSHQHQLISASPPRYSDYADCVDCRREFFAGGEENLRCAECLLSLDRAIARSVFAEPRTRDVKVREVEFRHGEIGYCVREEYERDRYR